MVFSTNDYTTVGTTPPPGMVTEDGWADTKTVRTTTGTRTYSVGATVVAEVLNPPATAGYFSYRPVELSTGMSGFSPSGTARRKVVILQAVDGTQNTQTIAWQRYFYGTTFGQALDGHETNPRAVAVWAAEEEVDMRIAICGETFDADIPADFQSGGGTPTRPNGFVAVYDGDGRLLWSHLFHGPEGWGDCAVTDLSIRVVEIEGQKQDLVTYCGVSTYGLLTSGPLAPVAPFTSVPGATGYTPGLGDSDNGVAQWDGFVGRLRHSENQGFRITTTDFHSIVGGTAQDGLFGLAELDDLTFIAVGTTRRGQFDVATAGYPFTNTYPAAWGATPWTSTTWYSVGVYTIFSTANLATTGLEVWDSAWAGSVSWVGEAKTWTHCHDVAAAQLVGGFCIVGGTNDANFLARSAPQFRGGASNAPGTKTNLATGDCDGFVMWSSNISTPQSTVGLFGTDAKDVMTGVAMWSEYAGYAVFAGWEMHPSSPVQQIRCGSISQGSVVRDLQILDNTLAHPATTPGAQALIGQVVEFYFDEPASGFTTFSSGGVGIDDRGRANVVGMSFAGYPYIPPGLPPQFLFMANDAVRSTVDMLPQGVSRTDGTGTRVTVPPGGWEAPPQPSGYHGGTTPTGTAANPCQKPFGWQIGDVPGEVHRVLIDYHGAAPAYQVSAKVASEGYIGGSGLLAALMQIGLPPTMPMNIGTTEIWTVANPQPLVQTGTGWAYVDWQLPTMIQGPLQFTVQVIWVLQTPLACDPAGLVASPGMVIDYN